jgi:hypothetical protein
MRLFSKAGSLLLFLFFILFFHTIAQTARITGQVIDAETRDALAFVTIQFNEGPEGCISDIDGRFIITSSVPVYKLKLSYIGYESDEYIIEKNAKDILIRLNKTAYELSEIVIKPGINPANRIISQVIANRDINNHENLPSFTYTSYEKTVFGPESDSIPPVDSIEDIETYLKVKEFFLKQQLFIMESVVKRGFMFPSENYNKVIASRVSGFKDPLFVFLMSQMQSTTFYTDLINIVGVDYINPISKGSLKKYYFEIQDTLIEPFPYDTTYTLLFRPLMNTNFEALKGSLAISTNGFAIRNVIAWPASGERGPISAKIQQKYDFIDSTHWFPVQLNTDLVIKTKEIIIDSIHKRSIKIMGRGKSYISDINLDPKLQRNQFGVFEVDVQPEAYKQPEEIWNKYRIDSLTSREQTTYRVVDSLGKARNFDKRTNKFNALTGGTLSLGYADFYLDNLFRVNQHEGFRLGLKLSTSDKVLSWMRVGGYVAYGFKDEKFKYGAEGLLIFDRFRNFYLKGGYYDDVDEAGADEKFINERNLLNPERFREILVSRMDRTRIYKADISSRTLKYMTLGAGFSVYNKVPLYNYSYLVQSSENIAVTTSDFAFTEASLLIRYAYGEKFLRNERSTISLGTKYPVVQLFASHGFNNFLNGQYVYNRFDLKISKSFFTKYVGTTSFSFHAGWIDRDIPYVNLYNAKASYISFNLYSPGSFATMRMDEFIADKYASLFFSHNFGKLLFTSRHFNPEPELVTSIGFGSLSHPENHIKSGIKSYEKGYFESGLVINKIIRLGLVDVGFAGFYRYGPYSLSTFKENMSWNVVFQFIL